MQRTMAVEPSNLTGEGGAGVREGEGEKGAHENEEVPLLALDGSLIQRDLGGAAP